MEGVLRLRMPTFVPVTTSTWDTTAQVTIMWMSVYLVRHAWLSTFFCKFLQHTNVWLFYFIFLQEINPSCTNITCQNGGSCLYVNETHNAQCVCLQNYVGQFCQGNPKIIYLPPAYVVRGTVLFSQVSVCSHLEGGVPTFQAGEYLPSQVWMGGTPSNWRVGGEGLYPLPRSGQGGYLSQLMGVTPSQVWRVPHWRGYPAWKGVPASRGYPPARGTPQQGVPPGGGTPLAGATSLPEQHSMYLLRGGRCASCVHAGGLSCLAIILSK